MLGNFDDWVENVPIMIKMTSSQTFPIKTWFMTRIAIPMTKLVTNPTIAFAEISSPRVAGVIVTADTVFCSEPLHLELARLKMRI